MRNALVDLKVVPKASVVLDPEQHGAWVIPRLEQESVTVGSVQAALAKMRGEFVLADVQWADYCPECGPRPTFEMGTPNCKAR